MTAYGESTQGPDLGLSGALCYFFMTSGVLSEEIGSLGARGEVSKIETQARSSSINPQRQTENRLARHIKTSLSNTSAHELQITPGQRWSCRGTVNVSGDTDKNSLTPR